ncbi:MAG: MopE-related protein [Pseudomonadota bacterium]
MRSPALLFLSAVLGCSDQGITVHPPKNEPPDATISFPADGEVVKGGELTLLGTALDPDGLEVDLEVQWLLGDEIACSGLPTDEDGHTSCTVALDHGDTTITLEVSDAAATGTAQATVHVEHCDVPTYRDADSDGFGDPSEENEGCSPEDGWVEDASDCDDGDATIHPGADEWCDGVDTDCDGTPDEEDALDAATWYADADGDGHGDAATTTTACYPPSGFVADDSDCDDALAAVNPAATEACDGRDDDCDGAVDETGATGEATWCADTDGDGYGDVFTTIASCTQPTGFVADATDCDDALAAVNPAASEACNDRDDDCDGATDEAGAIGEATWYADTDGDGYGDPGWTTTACTQPSGTSADATDCDDGDAAAHPGAAEPCDAVDNDCDGTVDEGCVGCDLEVSRSGSAPYVSIQAALWDASDGDIICVGPGTYDETGIDTLGLAVTLLGTGGPTVTILESTSSSASAALSITRAEGIDTVIDGFTLSGALATGRGVYLWNASPRLRNLWIRDFTYTGTCGGGVYMYGASPLIENVLVTGNEAPSGGGFCLDTSANPVLTNVRIEGNTATHLGGGWYSTGWANFDMQNVVIAGNQADSWAGGGGGLVVECYSSPVMTNVSIVGNTSAGVGGGLYVNYSSCTPILTNTDISGNAAGLSGGGMFVQTSCPGPATFQNNNWYGNSPDDILGYTAYPGTFGNLNEDPAYQDVSAPDPADWDLHLGATSLLIDAGSGTDPDGDAADIGAYGGTGAGDWDLDLDGYPEWYHPGTYDSGSDPVDGLDCDDRDASVLPGSGC